MALEVIEAAADATGLDVPHRIGDRRPGDPAVLVASSRRTEEVLGWRRRFPDLETIIIDAFEWRRRHPNKIELLTQSPPFQESQRVLDDCRQLSGRIRAAARDPDPLFPQQRVRRPGEESRKSL